MRADRLMLDGRTLDQVERGPGRVIRRAGAGAAITGRLPDGGDIALSLAPEGDQRRLRVTSTDAGNLLRTLDQTSRIEGGELKLEAAVSQQWPSLVAEGMLEASDFRVLDAPILARLLTLASPTGMSDLLGGEGHLDRAARGAVHSARR